MLIFQAQRSCTLKLRVVDAYGSKGQCWTCSVYINFMHREGWETSFSKTMHAELSALMKSSAQTIAKPLYSSDIRAFYRMDCPIPTPKHKMFLSCSLRIKCEIWTTIEQERQGILQCPLSVYSSFITLLYQDLTLFDSRIIANINASKNRF